MVKLPWDLTQRGWSGFGGFSNVGSITAPAFWKEFIDLGKMFQRTSHSISRQRMKRKILHHIVTHCRQCSHTSNRRAFGAPEMAWVIDNSQSGLFLSPENWLCLRDRGDISYLRLRHESDPHQGYSLCGLSFETSNATKYKLLKDKNVYKAHPAILTNIWSWDT